MSQDQTVIEETEHHLALRNLRLDDYNDIKNRNVKLWEGEDVDESVKKILEHLKQKDNEGAKAALDSLFKIFAKYGKEEYEKS